MKKAINYLSTTSLLCMAVSVQANEFGSIRSYSEVIQPSERNGSIEITVSGLTNDKGMLFLPSYEDSSITRFSALKGQLQTQPKTTSVYGRDVLVYQFSTPNSEVQLKQTLYVEDVYKTQKAKIKDSQPGGVERISYKFTNTSPVSISKYTGLLSVPHNTELYGVVTPEWSKKEKSFEIKREGNWKVIEVVRNKVAPGNGVEFKIRTYSPSPVIKWTLWSLVIFLSGILLWKRRDVITNQDGKPEAETVKAATN